jgi:DNA-binding transcriptional regulator YhcF (GntR family)
MARHDHRDAGSSKAPARAASSQALPQASASEAQLDLEDLAIDRAGEIPIGVQLAWALRARISDGRLAPGRRLPGLRELAEMLGINANTARAVYQRLEQEGLIDSRQGTGTFVASTAQEPSAVGQIAADAARQAHRTGVDPREVAAALYVTAEPPADDAAQAAERRRDLRAQIAALEQTLSEIQARHPGLISAPSRPPRHAGPRLLSIEELERVRTGLVRRLAAAEPLLEETLAAGSPAVERGRRSATMRAAESKTVEPPEAKQDSRKAARPRARTRPSTA